MQQTLGGRRHEGAGLLTAPMRSLLRRPACMAGQQQLGKPGRPVPSRLAGLAAPPMGRLLPPMTPWNARGAAAAGAAAHRRRGLTMGWALQPLALTASQRLRVRCLAPLAQPLQRPRSRSMLRGRQPRPRPRPSRPARTRTCTCTPRRRRPRPRRPRRRRRWPSALPWSCALGCRTSAHAWHMPWTALRRTCCPAARRSCRPSRRRRHSASRRPPGWWRRCRPRQRWRPRRPPPRAQGARLLRC